MKTFFALLISCLTLSAATTYPVLTDSTNRLFPGGVTNVFFLNSNVVTTGTMRATGALTLTNSGNVFAGDGSGLTGVGGGGGTNAPLLNGTNTFTGTNTFDTNTVVGTNVLSDFVGDMSRWRLLYRGVSTNWTPQASTAATNTLFSITLPPLRSATSQVYYRAFTYKTNVTAQPGWSFEFRANSTNGPTINGQLNILNAALYYGGTPSAGSAGGPSTFVVFQNINSFSTQLCYGTNYIITSPVFDLGWDTMAETNTLHVMLINSSASGTAPIQIPIFELYERY